MKNTKNLLITGLILTTTLFTSVQIFADLTNDQLMLVMDEIQSQKESIQTLSQIRNLHRQNGNNRQADLTQKTIDAKDTMVDKLRKLSKTTYAYSNLEFSDKMKRIKSGQ